MRCGVNLSSKNFLRTGLTDLPRLRCFLDERIYLDEPVKIRCCRFRLRRRFLTSNLRQHYFSGYGKFALVSASPGRPWARYPKLVHTRQKSARIDFHLGRGAVFAKDSIAAPFQGVDDLESLELFERQVQQNVTGTAAGVAVALIP